MRRSLRTVAVLLALLACAVVGSVARADPMSDGTLSIKRGRGDIFLSLTGAVLGRVGHGRITVTDVDPLDDQVPEVTHFTRTKVVSDGVTIYWGRQIKFTMIDGAYKLKIHGNGVHLSAVGKGWGTLDASDRYLHVGVYSLNGSPYKRLPYEKTEITVVNPYSGD